MRGAVPEWARLFQEAWARPSTGTGLPDDLGPAEVARPLIAHAQHRLRRRLAVHHDECGSKDRSAPSVSPAPPNLADLLCAEPPLTWLGMAVGPAITHELNRAVRAGTLTGATPRERYGDFVRRLADADAALPIWRAYPVLARHVTELLDHWVQARLAFARDLVADLPVLARTFTPDGRLGSLEAVRFGAAETHRGGRGVALVRFSHVTIVYKPRGLAIDRCFDRLLGWFNDAEPAYALRRARLLDRTDHGWCEHIAAFSCPRRELPGYFWRIGALLALTHRLHGFDLHADNVIAAGGHPVVIDLEALFHTEQTQPMLRRARLGDPAAARLAGSVLGTGLLPGPLVVPDVHSGRPFGVDFSPLGIAADRRSLIPIPVTENAGTDRQRIRLDYRVVPGPAGRLQDEDGGTVHPGRFRDEIVAGYTYAYERLLSAGPWLTAEGPLAGCADVPVRLIQLSTFLYVRLLLDSWRPEALRDVAVRERGLARLKAGWPGVPHRDALVMAELAALRRGEVPTFEIRPGHRDVWLEDGTRLRDVLGETPLEAVLARLTRMGPDDLAAQVSIIDAGLATLPATGEPAAQPEGEPAGARSSTAGSPGVGSSGAGSAACSEAPLDQAARIAERLRETAVRSAGRIGWVTLEVVDARSRRVAPAGLDLYGGLPGIGLFLSYASVVTDDARIGELAPQVAEEVVRRCHAAAALDRLPGITTAGVFGPLLGPVYYLAHAAAIHDEPGYAETACDVLLPAVPQALANGAAADVAEGAAGAVLALLALHAVVPHEEILMTACGAGERLLTGDLTDPGFGYGASGAAVALTRLHALVPDRRYASAARKLILGEAGPGDETGWCQGAAGIGLARVELMRSPVFADLRPALRQALDEAAGRVAGGAAFSDDSACHGRFAHAELLTALGKSSPASYVPSIRGWRTALPDPAPGLLAGLSGIGVGLLRLAAPDVVPSVLGLVPPKDHH